MPVSKVSIGGRALGFILSVGGGADEDEGWWLVRGKDVERWGLGKKAMCGLYLLATLLRICHRNLVLPASFSHPSHHGISNTKNASDSPKIQSTSAYSTPSPSPSPTQPQE
jgi:hypothetical protein